MTLPGLSAISRRERAKAPAWVATRRVLRVPFAHYPPRASRGEAGPASEFGGSVNLPGYGSYRRRTVCGLAVRSMGLRSRCKSKARTLRQRKL